MRYLLRCLLLLSVLGTFGTSLPSIASASLYEPPINPRFLDGVDTISTYFAIGPGANILLENYTLGKDVRLLVHDTVQDLFKDQPWVQIKCSDCPPYGFSAKDEARPNVIQLWIRLSAREEIVEGSNVKIAALSLQLLQSHYYKNRANFSPWAVTYPFVVPPTQREFEEKLRDGVRYLTDFLPFRFCNRNPKGNSCKRVPGYEMYSEKLPSAVKPQYTPELPPEDEYSGEEIKQ